MLGFYERIDKILKEKKRSQKDLSEHLQISSAQVFANWKQRDFIPSADIAVKIAQYLGTSVEYLITGEEKDIYKEKYETLKKNLELTLQREL
jgi:transcriptional regulator with XRE-family HTH domain